MKRTVLNSALILLLAGSGSILLSCHFPITFWPIEPTGAEHQIGNSGGEFQEYSATPYFHKGIDILDGPAPTGPFVRTTRAGVPTLSLVTDGAGACSTASPANLYSGLTVDHPDGTHYDYWHLDCNSIQQPVRDADDAGASLPANTPVSQLIPWSACSYNHLHYEQTDGALKEDPVWSVSPRSDSSDPTIINIFFTEDGTNTEFPVERPARSVVSGNVDVIAHAYDTQFGTARTGVMLIRYRVTNSAGGIVHTGQTINFSQIPSVAAVSILFRNSSPFDSNSNYCSVENYYYVVTNISAAGTFSESNAWNTAAHPNGIYNVTVQAYDAFLNVTSFTKQVRINN